MKGLRCIGILLLLQVLSPATARAQQVRHVQQATPDGILEGVVSSDEKVRTFKGIPYAAPPIGALRWREPAPVAPWPNVRRAIEYPPRCMQGPTPPDLTFNDGSPSEDCLYLNLWMPAHPAVAKLPVMVWINGENFASGSSSEPRQDAGNLSKKGVLVVTFNYRLGVFGFLALPDLEGESPQRASGNYGLLDQIAALKWVHKNVANFGGDPDNVTIFGAGSGSVSVSGLMASPLAESLFQKAIGEGGSCLVAPGRLRPRSMAEAQGVRFARAAFGTTSPDKLRSVPATILLEHALTQQRFFRPDVDGHFLPKSCDEIYRTGKQAHIPLLAGYTHDSSAPGSTAAQDEALSLWMEHQLKQGVTGLFRYRFVQALPAASTLPTNPGRTSQDEVEFVFRVLSSRKLPWRAQDRSLSETVSSYWSNFARTGNPNQDSLPQWSPYTGRNSGEIMIFGSGEDADFRSGSSEAPNP